MTREELAAHPSYPELLAADGHNLLGRLAALEHTSAGQQGAIDALTDLLKSTMQQVNDLSAQLAQHEAAPYPHVRYDMRAIGHIVLDGLAPLDYDVAAQTDGPMLVDSELTDDQRNRIWQRVQAATNGEAA